MTTPALVDRHGRAHTYLRISVTDRCNLRCAYCMPEQGIDWTPPAHLLQTDEIIRLATVFVKAGIHKIRLTGGEPLLHREIGRIVERLAALDGLNTLAMTTNGLRLAERAAGLRARGLHSVTISLDSLNRERYARITRRDRLPEAMRGITAALHAGFDSVKINTVIMQGVNDGELLDFIDWGKDLPIELRFIEYMPFPDNRWSVGGLLPYAEMRRVIEEKYALTPLAAEAAAVGKSFAIAGHLATVSFVTSMTESFCGGCNRLRLTADGHIKACLFNPEEKSLRDVLRRGGSDEELLEVIRAALGGKWAAHPPMEELLAMNNRTMIAIGG